jgi:ABC-type transporter Mla MlaB component
MLDDALRRALANAEEAAQAAVATGAYGEAAHQWSRALDLIDSSGVAALVKLYKGVRAGGGSIQISGARDQPLAIFKLLRMDKVFNL